MPFALTAVIAGMVAVLAALSVFAGPVMDSMTAMSQQLLEPQGYIRAVLPPAATAGLVGG